MKLGIDGTILKWKNKGEQVSGFETGKNQTGNGYAQWSDLE